MASRAHSASVAVVVAAACIAAASAQAVGGTIYTVAGTGVGGYNGDNVAATSAELYHPFGISFDNFGGLIVADQFNSRIRKVAPHPCNSSSPCSLTGAANTITTVAGTGVTGYSGDGGTATAAQLYYAQGVAFDGSNNLFIADTFDQRIRVVATGTGIITTVAGTGTAGYSGDGVAATSSKLYQPFSIVFDSAGDLFISDFSNCRVRKVSMSSNIISTAAGTGTSGYSGDGGAATSAQLSNPRGLAIDGSGNLFIADYVNNCVRKVAVATGIITTVAGTGSAGYSGDGGAATSANLYNPWELAFDLSGNLVIADTQNNRIRSIASGTNIITTIAGTGTAGYNGDGGAATSAELYNPIGIAYDSSGNLFIAETGNNRVRMVTFQSPTPTQTPSVSSTSTRSLTATPSASSTLSGTQTSSPSRTPSNSPTRSITSTQTGSSSQTPSNSPTRSGTGTQTASSSQTASNSPTRSITSSVSCSPSQTSSNSPTSSFTPSRTSSPSQTLTPTSSGSLTSTPTSTLSTTRTSTPTITHTTSPTTTKTSTTTGTSSLTFTPSPSFSSRPACASTTALVDTTQCELACPNPLTLQYFPCAQWPGIGTVITSSDSTSDAIGTAVSELAVAISSDTDAATFTATFSLWNAGTSWGLPLFSTPPTARLNATATPPALLAGCHFYTFEFGAVSGFNIGADRYTAWSVALDCGSATCTLPLVLLSTSLSAYDFTSNISAIQSDFATASSLTVPGWQLLFRMNGDAQRCASPWGWRGLPYYAYFHGDASMQAFVRYVPTRCRSVALDVIALLLFCGNMTVLLLTLGAMYIRGRYYRGTRPWGAVMTEFGLLLGMCICLFTQAADALWFLCTDWDIDMLSFEWGSFALLVMNPLLFVLWGSGKLLYKLYPRVREWATSLFVRIPTSVAPTGVGIYRFFFHSHLELHELIVEVGWVTIVALSTPVLLAIQSILFTSQLMSLEAVAMAWARFMGYSVFDAATDGSRCAAKAAEVNVWAWNMARLSVVTFESFPSVILQAAAMGAMNAKGEPLPTSSQLALAFACFMLGGHIYHYLMHWYYVRKLPWELDPTDFVAMAPATKVDACVSTPMSAASNTVLSQTSSVPMPPGASDSPVRVPVHAPVDPASGVHKARGWSDAETPNTTPASGPTLLQWNDIKLAGGPPLGCGSFGIVHKGVWQGRVPVAVKLMYVDSGEVLPPTFLSDFHAEVALHWGLRHPHVVIVYGSTEKAAVKAGDPPQCGIVMELMHQSLFSRLRRAPRMPFAETLACMLDIASALKFLHSQRVVHADIKSANILVTADGRCAKLTDFGLSRAKSIASTTTAAKTTLGGGGGGGSLLWMAPELHWNVSRQRAGEPSFASDVYALGITMFEMLTGALPYVDKEKDGFRVHTMLPAAVAQGMRPTMELVPSDVPREVVALMQRCWAENPGSRPTAAQVEVSLTAVQYHEKVRPDSGRGGGGGTVMRSVDDPAHINSSGDGTFSSTNPMRY